MMKKMFKSKNNLIITIVALVECILLLAITTYSWIESASSLRIATAVGQPVTIADSINYDYVIDYSKAKAVDLSTYFSNIANFSFAQASSANAETFYFKKPDGSYRTGDTTDYNTSYYNFDFRINSGSGSASLLYFFNSQDIFTFDEKSIILEEGQTVTDDDKRAFLNAFRLAITKDDDTPTIYSYAGESCNAASSASALSTQTVKAFSDHLYDIDDTNDIKNTKQVFNNSDSNINIKIWFEYNDEDFSSLDSKVKTALLGATVDINLVFNNAESSFRTFRFNDYTQSIPENDTSDKTMYFYDGNKAYPMTKVAMESEPEDDTDLQPDGGTDDGSGEETVIAEPDYTAWATCDENGDVLATVPDAVINNLYTADKCYYFYGTVDADGDPVVTYQWLTPVITQADYDGYTFNALSVTPTGTKTTVGVGDWDYTPIKAVQFIDKTTYNGDNAYNAGGYQFVAENHLYFGRSGDTTPIKMNLIDTDNKTYKAYVPADFLNNQTCFYYTRSSYYTSSVVQITWTAAQNPEDTPKYTALGYSDKGKLSNTSFKSQNGVGTWDETKRINLSTELVDTTTLAHSDYRFRIFYNADNKSVYTYLATDVSDPLTAYAYVPEGATLSQYNYLNAGGTITAYWSIGGATYDSDTYYLTSISATTSAQYTGQWNPVVLVDGTADNLISFTLDSENETGGALEYSTDGEIYYPMTQVDSYRWVTDDLGILSGQTVYFKWTAYKANADKGFVETVFNYTFELVEGTTGMQYFVVTEAGSNYTPSN